MSECTERQQGHGFLIGLLAGAAAGAGLAIWLTPRVQRVRNDVADSVVRGAREVERLATAAKTDGLCPTAPPAE